MRKVFRARIEINAGRKTKLLFSGDCHSFDPATLKVLDEARSVDGWFRSDLPFRPDHYTCLFEGETDDLRTRLLENYKHLSIPGVTHFFAEASATDQQRKLRENEPIAEFHPRQKTSRD